MTVPVPMCTLALLSLAGPANALAPPASATSPAGPALLAFAEQMRSCTPAIATQPHPLIRGFTIEHAVLGLRGAHCDYTQSMPGGMRMACTFDDLALRAFADELRETATTGRMSGSSRDAAPAWMSACEIVNPPGKARR